MTTDYQERLFERILCSVNHDVRDAMIVSEAFGELRTSHQIRKNLLEFIGYATHLLPQNPSFTDYCKLLKTRGFAKKYVLDHPRTRNKHAMHWKITSDGETDLQPAAALGIRASNSFRVSVFHVLGKTGAPPGSKSRSAYNTGRILRTLYNRNGKIRERELVESLEIFPSDVKTHCEKLSKFGFVERRVYAHPIYGPAVNQATDSLTESGECFVENFILPIWSACGDSNYRAGEYRNALEEYLQDRDKMKREVKNALIIHYRAKHRKND